MTRLRTYGKGTVGVDSTATGETRLSGAEGADGGDGARPQPGVPRAAEAPLAPEFLQQVADEVRAWFPRQIEGPELVLIDVDPRVLHAFWSLPLALVQDARATLGAAGATAPLVLRLAPAEEDASAEDGNRARRGAFDVIVSGLQSRAYIDIEAAARRWRATLGIKRGDGTLIAFAHANVAALPPSGPAPLQALPVEAPAGPAVAAAASRADTALPLATQASAAPAVAEPPAWATAELKAVLPAEAAAITEAQPEPASAPDTASGAAETAAETAAEAAAGPFALEDVLPLSSFVLGRGGNDVELEVTAELYIHGRIQPGRTLQLFGKDIRVRPDGTFALRRILPNDPAILTVLLASEEVDDLEGRS